MQKFDVVIIGGGVVGLNMAYSLIKEDLNVSIAVIDNNSYFSEAAGAMISTITELSHQDRHQNEMIDNFVNAGKFFSEQWINDFSSENANLIKGIYYVANAFGGENDLKEINYLIEISNQYNLPYMDVQPKDIPFYKPTNKYYPTKAALFNSDFSLDAPAYIENLRKKLLNRVVFQSNNVISIDSELDIKKIKLDSNETLLCKYVICATGILTNTLFKYSNLNVPIHKQHGLAIDIETNKKQSFFNCIRTPTRGFSCGHHLVSRGNSIYLGSTNSYSLLAKNTYNIQALTNLLTNGVKEINQSLNTANIKKIHSGYRSMTIDKKPIIDEIDTNIFLITGFYRNAYLLSPYFCSLFVKQIFCKENHPSLSKFKIERFNNLITIAQKEYLNNNMEKISQFLVDNLVQGMNEFDRNEILKNLYMRVLDKYDWTKVLKLPFPEGLVLINTLLKNEK
jgi:glycine oxidase